MRKIKRNNAPLEAFLADPAAMGAFLRSVRHESGLTQAEAAGLCNVGTRFLNELEHGKVTAALGKTLQVFRGYGVRLQALRRRAPGGD